MKREVCKAGCGTSTSGKVQNSIIGCDARQDWESQRVKCFRSPTLFPPHHHHQARKTAMSLSPSPPPKPAKKKTFMFKRANLGATSGSASDELSFFSRNRENYVGAVEPKEDKKPEVKKKHTRGYDGGDGCDDDDEDGAGTPPKRAKRRSIVGDDDEDSGDEIVSRQKRHENARERCGFFCRRQDICSGLTWHQIQRLRHHTLRLGVFAAAEEQKWRQGEIPLFKISNSRC